MDELPRQFLRIVGSQPLLSAEEERGLARQAAAGDGEAAQRLILSHLRLVVRIAKLYRGSGLPLGELVQEGTLGLLRAVRRFDPDQRDARLATYAMWWVRSAIQDHVIACRSLVRMGTTSGQKAMLLRLRRLVRDGADALLNDETAARLAAHFNATALEMRQLARRMLSPDRSLNQPLGDGEEEVQDRIPAPAPSPEDVAIEKSVRRYRDQVLAAAVDTLSPRERLIICRRYLEEHCPSLDTVSREIGLSKERVRQLEKTALAKLRRVLAPKAAEMFG